MDLSKLKEKIPILINNMRESGYARQYIWDIGNMAKWMHDNQSRYGWNCYQDIELTLSETEHNHYTKENKIQFMRTVARFNDFGTIPNSPGRYVKPSKYSLLGSGYKTLIDESFGAVPRTESYRYAIKNTLSAFFYELQGCGVDKVNDITPDVVLRIFSPQGKPGKNYRYKHLLEKGLRMCADTTDTEFIERIISWLPCIPNSHKNIQYLTSEEYEKIKDTVERDMSLSMRDKAIMTLVMYTGLRSSDITGMKVQDIDWEREVIEITQAKTGNPLSLPLRALVGNAIYDYMTMERPQSESPYVFVGQYPPHRKLRSANLNAICSNVMYKAGVRQASSDRRGMHLFRHNVATRLLGNGVSQPIISSTLGHSAPTSLDHYIDTEFERLKECALDISGYPIRKEVFE